MIKSFIKHIKEHGLTHCLGVPLLHAVLWAAALLLSQKAREILPSMNDETMEAVQFISIFVVFFLEILIVLIDIYISSKANYISPRFIIFIIALLFLLIVTAVCSCIAINKEFNIPINDILPVIILSSAALKLIENLLLNNTKWYIITDPQIRDARGFYTRRRLRTKKSGKS